MSIRRIAVCAILTAGALGATATAANPAGSPLTPSVATGDHFTDVFSVTSATTAQGFDVRVRRNSGSANYAVTRVGPDGSIIADETDIYDGSPVSHGESAIRNAGATICWNGDCRLATDASGLLYNPLLWGTPPTHLKRGMTWHVQIGRPWELGPAGTETVTVIDVGAGDGRATLEREGFGQGLADHEASEVTLSRNGQPATLTVQPGQAHWIGYATFRRGLVLSDELMVERTDRLVSKDGSSVSAMQRRYTLLNAAPVPAPS